MNWNRRQLKVYTTTYEAILDNGPEISIYSYDGYDKKVCEWIVWPGDSGKAIAKGICYGVKEAKTQAEQAARDYDAKERVK